MLARQALVHIRYVIGAVNETLWILYSVDDGPTKEALAAFTRDDTVVTTRGKVAANSTDVRLIGITAIFAGGRRRGGGCRWRFEWSIDHRLVGYFLWSLVVSVRWWRLLL